MQKQIIEALLSAANKGYEKGELELDKDIPSGERGDALADFVASEIREVIPGHDDFESARQVAISAMESATRQLQDVIAELETVEPPREVEQAEILKLTEDEAPGLLRSISDDDLCAGCHHLCYRPGELSLCELSQEDAGWPGTSDANGYIQSCEKFVQLDK